MYYVKSVLPFKRVLAGETVPLSSKGLMETCSDAKTLLLQSVKTDAREYSMIVLAAEIRRCAHI